MAARPTVVSVAYELGWVLGNLDVFGCLSVEQWCLAVLEEQCGYPLTKSYSQYIK